MDITKFVKDKIELWERGNVQITEGLTFNAHQTLKKILYYTESKYESGQKDRRGKLKPFFNIVNFRVNVATRATDLDTKDIQIVADEPQFMPMSFLLQKEVYNWMKDSNFAQTLNEMGQTRAKFGGVLVKKCMEQEEGEEEELELEVVDWRNVIVDPGCPDEMVIEKHYMTENELAEKDGVWDGVREAIDVVRKTPAGKLEVFELTAELPEAYAPEGGDEYTYRIQKFIMYNKTKSGKAVIMYHEFLDEFPYKYLAWEKVNGRLGRGIVEDGFEAQQWTNDAVIKEKEAMELGSKVIFKSTDPNIQNNILSEVENGQIIKIAQGSDLAIANTITNNLPEFRQLIQSWDSQLEKTTSTFNAVTGETMPSGTAYRTTAILNQEATSMFDYRREEMGIFLVEIFTDWIIPYLLKKFNKAHILAAEFTPDELAAIDDSFANFEANQKVKASILAGNPIYAEDYAKLVAETKDLLKKSKDKRFLDIPKGQYKNWKPKVTILTTGEQKNKAVILESLNNVLMTAAKAPQVLTDPTLSKVFAKILEVSGSGISPISLGMGNSMTASPVEQAQAQAEAPVAPTLPVVPGQPAQ
jgi:hypothetical protein